jgi:hypothetical protein
VAVNAAERPSDGVDAMNAKYPLFARATIQRLVDEETAKYRDAKVRTFVPVLVMRTVDARLRAANGD